MGENDFLLVGKNKRKLTVAGLNTFVIREELRIKVKRGDFIGIHFNTHGLQGVTSYRFVETGALNINYKMNDAQLMDIGGRLTSTSGYDLRYDNKNIALRATGIYCTYRRLVTA